MSWIKIRTNLATDPSVSAIALRTKLHPRQVVGCLVAVWCWADPLTENGTIDHASASLIDDIAGKKGFADAMASVSWLSIENERVTFPRWDRHHSQSAKARAGETERKRIARESGMSVRKMSGQTSGQSAEQIPDQRRGEEIREDKNTTPPTPAAVAPEEKKPRARNELLDALATVGGGSPGEIPPSRWSAVQRCLREIKAVCPDLTVAEIQRRAHNYRNHFHGATISPEALMKHWAACDCAPLGFRGFDDQPPLRHANAF